MAAPAARPASSRGLLRRPSPDHAFLRAFLERDRLYAAYALCDLDDREFGRTRWGVAFAGTDPPAVVLGYPGLATQPVFVMGEGADTPAVLRQLIRPRAAYLAARPEH